VPEPFVLLDPLDDGRGALERLIEPFGLPSPLGSHARGPSAQ